MLSTRSLLVDSPTVTLAVKLVRMGSYSTPYKENSDAVNTVAPSARSAGMVTKCVMLVKLLESSGTGQYLELRGLVA